MDGLHKTSTDNVTTRAQLSLFMFQIRADSLDPLLQYPGSHSETRRRIGKPSFLASTSRRSTPSEIQSMPSFVMLDGVRPSAYQTIFRRKNHRLTSKVLAPQTEQGKHTSGKKMRMMNKKV